MSQQDLTQQSTAELKNIYNKKDEMTRMVRVIVTESILGDIKKQYIELHKLDNYKDTYMYVIVDNNGTITTIEVFNNFRDPLKWAHDKVISDNVLKHINKRTTTDYEVIAQNDDIKIRIKNEIVVDSIN